MDQRTNKILFALLRSAICGTKLADAEREMFSEAQLQELLKISAKHDVIHLLISGLKQNGLIPPQQVGIEKYIFKAVYRYERLRVEYEKLCQALEEARIPFIPLKGSVLRKYYPEPWMRTSCDIDVLVHKEDLSAAVAYLAENLHYEEKGRGTHEIPLHSPSGVHVELHFDLIEEGLAKNAITVLSSVWEHVTLHEGSAYWHEMGDACFYFYHIAHMAKHFENGGCGIRPFLDLWILDRMENADLPARNALLATGGLLQFAETSRKLSRVWFGGETTNDLLQQMQDVLLHGGVYGSVDNRVALQQGRRGGKAGYLFSRIFIPMARLKRYYPILEKHPWLMPVMQVRRWFMLLRPDVARRTKRELITNASLEDEKTDVMHDLMKQIGLD